MGRRPGQKLITDHGGCNPLFRSNPPSPFFVGDGPRDGGEGATPMAGSGIPRFDPADPATFDPFGMDDKAVDCAEFARQVTGNSDGFIESLGHLDDLIADGHAIQTEGPPGPQAGLDPSASSDGELPGPVDCEALRSRSQ